jgi:hypothetical protein
MLVDADQALSVRNSTTRRMVRRRSRRNWRTAAASSGEVGVGWLASRAARLCWTRRRVLSDQPRACP